MFLIRLALATLVLAGLPLQAAVIDFDSPPIPHGGRIETAYTEDGFRLTGEFVHYGTADPTNSYVTNGSAGGMNLLYGQYFTLQTSNGALFSIESLDLGALYEHFDRHATTFYGQKESGAIVSLTVPGSSNPDFITVAFSDEFRRLESFWVETRPWNGDDITAEPNSYDNFRVNAIPVPGAVWLLGSGLLALAGYRRKP